MFDSTPFLTPNRPLWCRKLSKCGSHLIGWYFYFILFLFTSICIIWFVQSVPTVAGLNPLPSNTFLCFSSSHDGSICHTVILWMATVLQATGGFVLEMTNWSPVWNVHCRSCYNSNFPLGFPELFRIYFPVYGWSHKIRIKSPFIFLSRSHFSELNHIFCVFFSGKSTFSPHFPLHALT